MREAVGIAAYHAGHFAEALSDLRAARRMTGSDAFLPVMADCERGLGRPERALDLTRSKEAERLDQMGKIELAIVESGARRDLGQKDAAVVTLQRLSELRDPRPQPWSARLAFAYADALADAGHAEAATEWFGRAMAFDEDGETDAAERYAELTGAVIEDLEEDADDEPDGEADDYDAFEGEAEDEIEDEIEDEDEDEADDVDGPAIEEGEQELEELAHELDADLEEDDEPDTDLEDDESAAGDAGEGESSTAVKDEDTAGEEASAGQKAAGKAGTGVGPAFIEPDFGDILDDDVDDADGTAELGDTRDKDAEEDGK
ncbi:hypothetical protein ACFFMN_02795 [Planobispora siamensis]|uniref:hypothetical protein n=1 Tax=Planobispora siamensis TaxID=936338 RepID=UPI0035E9706C